MESTKRISLSRRPHKRGYLYLFVDASTCLTKSHQSIGQQINYPRLFNRIYDGLELVFSR